MSLYKNHSARIRIWKITNVVRSRAAVDFTEVLDASPNLTIATPKTKQKDSTILYIEACFRNNYMILDRGVDFRLLALFGWLHLRYQTFVTFVRLIFLCSWCMPYNRASTVGGHPGTYTSTGTILSTPRTTL
jgi:hypothetical protein